MIASLFGGSLSNLTLSISVANLSANMDGVLQQVAVGNIIAIALTDPGTPDFPLTAAQMINDSRVLALVTTPYLPVVAVADAYRASLLGGMAQGVKLADTAVAIQGALDGLEGLSDSKAATIGAITITGTAVASLSITASQLTADAGILAKIRSPYALRLSATAAQVPGLGLTGNPAVASVTVIDTTANVLANIDALEALYLAGKLRAITLTDSAPSLVNLPASRAAADADVLARLHFVSGALTQVTQVAGTIYDVDGNRLLFAPTAQPSAVDIRTLATGADEVVSGVANQVAALGYLVPGGALFVSEGKISSTSNTLLLSENGTLSALGSLDSLQSLRVAGAYAEWSTSTSLRVLNVTSSAGPTLVSGSYGNWMNDVTAQGQVAAWTSDYNIVGYKSGVISTIVDSPIDADTYVRTDGISYLYRQGDLIGNLIGQHTSLILNRNGIEIPLVTDLTYTFPGLLIRGIITTSVHQANVGQPDTDYRITAGWVAFLDHGVLYEIAPDSTERNPVATNVTSITALAADGSVAYQTAAGLALALPDAAGFDIYQLGKFANARNADGTWYVYDTSTLYRFTLPPPPVIAGVAAAVRVDDTATVNPLAAFQLTDSNAGATETATVTLSNPANGVLSNLGGGSYDSTTGLYSVSGSTSSVTAALDGLVFQPTPRQVVTGQSVQTNLSIRITNALNGTATATTAIVASGSGAVLVEAGDGAQMVMLPGGASSVSSSGTNTIVAAGGSPTISAPVGNPLVFGNAAALTFLGGTGAASIVGGTAGNTISGGAGRMLLFASSATTYTGGTGAATVVGGSGPLVANMGAGGGVVFGGPGGSNILSSGTANATLVGGGGNDQLIATGAGQDALVAGGGAATLDGGAATGNNVFFGGSGADCIVGGAGNDLFLVGAANETLTGGGGNNAYAVVAGSTSRVITITDFDIRRNAIGLFGFGPAPAADQAALGAAQVVSGNNVVALSDGTTIVLLGVGQLQSYNFF